ncbi:hypothetical protein WISP_89250 [Willisornis vidua]|uniref:Uncharacterized protein n=1 Tax=Willisornis vidua TaxID=1566151 RepID=A0ABQ9D254_9PASS|nr:hypothetical protein WISP_89250 [Willisornis vidua]
MIKKDRVCVTTVLNDTLLAECGNSASRCLNWQNGSLVLKSVEKEDEGRYEFVFHNTTRYFTLEVFGDLLQHPWFIYILSGCAVGVLILVVVLPSVICCCMKRKHKFIPVPSEEKDDGLTMSVVSSEGVKSPPNGDHVEAQAAPADRPPKPDAAQTGQGIEPQALVEENLPVQIEAEEIPDPEVIVDAESHEDASDCFPDPTDD